MIPVASSSDSNGCVPTSSNCIIWQGPDIPCIDLCHGDTISEVVYKLATELCDLLNQTDLQNLDLSCLQLSSADQPADLNEFFQLIVNELCGLGGRCSALEGGSSGGGTTPSTTVNFASCLQYDNPVTGDPVVSGTVEEYAVLIGNKVCQILTDINTIYSTLTQHDTRITALENANNTLTLPTVTPTCVLPPTAQDMDVVLEALEEQFCELRTATGTASELISATSDQCANLSSADRLSGSGTMATIPGWNTQVINVSHALSNMWLTICDMRTALQSVMDCCAEDCTDILVAMSASLNTDGSIIQLDFTGTAVPSSFISCNPLGSLITITDSSGNSYTERAIVSNYALNQTYLSISIANTTLTPGSNYTVTLNHCVTNGSITCEKTVTASLENGTSCPTLNLTVDTTSISYDFNHVLGSGVSYRIELMDLSNTVIAIKTHNAQPNGTLSGSFTGLIAGTNYRIRAVVVIGGQADKVCPYTQVTTSGDPGQDNCDTPTSVTPSVSAT